MIKSMGPFASKSFLVKTHVYGGSRPSTARTIKIPFNMLSKGIQGMRQAGIDVTAVAELYDQDTKKLPEKKETTSINSRRSNREAKSIKIKETDLKSGSKRERKASSRRGRKKN